MHPPSNTDIARANRSHWDSDASDYHARHAPYLDGFHWSPEMLAESDVRLLGDVSDLNVLEIGCGSAPCSSWLQRDGVGFITAFDLSAAMLRHSDEIVPLVQADAQALPYRENSFDVAFSAFGALPFVPDIAAVFADVARVLRPNGRFVFSVTHPMRWIFPDDPQAFTAQISYFEDAYVEYAGETMIYAEYQHTVGDWVRALRSAGFILEDMLEPEWPEHLTEDWGQWSPARGKIFPGTAIFVATALNEPPRPS